MCQQHKFQLDQRISKRFIRTHCFLRITPTALEKYSPVLIKFKNNNNKKQQQQQKKTPGRDIPTVELICDLSWGERFLPI